MKLPRVGTAELWTASLDLEGSAGLALKEILTPQELERASRFHYDLHRRRYVAGRAILRRILSGYTGYAPEAIEFAVESQGKPSLSGDLAGMGFHFNVSHSEGTALYGFTCEGRIGVDVELLRPIRDADALAGMNYTADEARYAVEGWSESAVARPFLQIWTRKEACVKAAGGGLFIPLQGFDTVRCPGRVFVPELDGPGLWVEMEQIEMGGEWIGAVAVEGGLERVSLRRFDVGK